MGNSNASGLIDEGLSRISHPTFDQTRDFEVQGKSHRKNNTSTQDVQGQFDDVDYDINEENKLHDIHRQAKGRYPLAVSSTPSAIVKKPSSSSSETPPIIESSPVLTDVHMQGLAFECMDPVEEGIKERTVCRADEITSTDVLCGSGKLSNCHAGNVFFERLVDIKRKEYLEEKKKCKKAMITADIVKLIRGLTPPGRFLRKDSQLNDIFREIEDKKARDKTSQALREGISQLCAKGCATSGSSRQNSKSVEDKTRQNLNHKSNTGPPLSEFSAGHGIPLGYHPFMTCIPPFPFPVGSAATALLSSNMIQTPMELALLPSALNQSMQTIPFPLQLGQQLFMANTATVAAAATAAGIGTSPMMHNLQGIRDFLQIQQLIMASKYQMEGKIGKRSHEETLAEARPKKQQKMF